MKRLKSDEGMQYFIIFPCHQQFSETKGALISEVLPVSIGITRNES